jgi:alkylated DNA repair dioxygenase AlkB
MESWLVPEPTVERLALDEASWVDVVRGLVPRGDEVHDGLLSSAEWQQGQVFRYERWIDSPRQMAGYPAGTQPAIDEVDAWLRHRYGVRFGAPALALYRNERDSVAFHRDRELHWLDDTVIAVLTFGARRPWLMKPLSSRRYDVDDDTAGAFDFSPASGDLLVMGGATQARWLHAVPKVRGRCRTRISVQWRYTSRRGPRDTNPSFYDARHFSPSR